jgi:cytochrome oxidase Cu insertion factor (SCO1/SenC/PrrC family)
MSRTPQPSVLSSWVAAFGRLDAAHGWAVNLFAVAALALLGAAFLSARPRLLRPAVIAGALVCLADWVLVEDLGFLGGVGTDPNSMVPMALLFVGGYLAFTKVPVMVGATVVPIAAPVRATSRWARLTADPTYTFRTVAALAAVGVTLLGAVPMAAASVDPHADAVLAQAVDGAPQPVDAVAPAFSLVDQHGRPVTLAGWRGKTVVLTFLDDTCPVIAQELRTADNYLGKDARDVEMVAINANPRYIAPDYLAAFDEQEGLEHLANWAYLTAPLPDLRRVWKSYGESVIYSPGGAMIGHSEYAWVIDVSGRTRDILDTDPGPATSATEASFSAMLADTVKSLLERP